MLSTNPFTPGFGLTPAVLAGRGRVIEDFRRALVGNAPGRRSVLISGPRGSGKTVVLTQFEAVAAAAGWATITLHTSAPSLAEELRGDLVTLLRTDDPEAVTSQMTGAGISGVSASRQLVDRYDAEPASLGALLDRLAALYGQRGTGLLITLDELQSANPDQLHLVTQHVQDLIRRGRPMAFVAAGVRVGVDILLQHDRTTFLRRAHRVELGSVSIAAAVETIRQTVADTTHTITPEAAVRAGEVSEGYPYLIQLVGYHAWEQAGDSPAIEVQDVEQVIPAVITEMIRNVHLPTLHGLAERKMDYLRAMAQDDGPSNVADVAARMGVDRRYQSTYRSRLIEDELILSAGRGQVEFALPYLREAFTGGCGAASGRDPDEGVTRPLGGRLAGQDPER